jgi:hypothetical protein
MMRINYAQRIFCVFIRRSRGMVTKAAGRVMKRRRRKRRKRRSVEQQRRGRRQQQAAAAAANNQTNKLKQPLAS